METEPLTLINVFDIRERDIEAFLRQWRERAEFLGSQPGFRSLRLHRELKRKPLWITGYANDVMAYIPSARVLKEGGYEADSSQIYYGNPTRWSPAIEDRIIDKVLELAK